MKKFNLKKISQAVAFGIASTIAGLLPTMTQASDIEIYKVPESGKKTVMMMLDTSGSMTYCDSVPGHNEGNGRVTASNIGTKMFNGVQGRGEKKKETSKSGISYDAEICWIGNEEHPSRGTRLLRAMFELIDSDSLDDTLVLGVGRFNFGGTRASIDIPAQPLTPAHRARIRNYLGGVLFSGGTPTATSYAEVAAYMMGTTTDVPLAKQFITKEVYWPAADNAQWVACGGWSGEVSCRTGNGTQNWQRENQLIQNRNLFKAPCRLAGQYDCWSDRTQGVELDVPAEIKNNNLPYETSVSFKEFLGFSHAHPDTKAGSKYKSPLPTSKTERDCSGQAIYFLTDGYPNNTYESQYLMRAALDTKAGNFPSKYSDFTSGLGTRYLDANNSEGMAQVGELAKRLNNPELNPAGVSIKTAVVGFGSVFAEAEKFRKEVTTTNPDTGKTTTRVYYDCSGITTREIKNACYWGAKSYDGFTGGYGEGGFFYAQNSQDVINSLLQVVSDVETKSGELATGSPSIPFDPLDFRPDTTAYYASFTPVPEKAQQLWTGNMNKYNVTDGRLLSGKNNVPLLKSDGNFNELATGIWDTASGKGALGQLDLKKNNNTERTVFTNREISSSAGVNGTSLTQVTVSQLYSMTGKFRNDPYKNYWLNLLGYNVPETGEVREADLENRPELRQLGAVMHSLPVFITQQAKIDDDNNISNRQDYVVYGSTQGLLHVVDAHTGKEKLAFAPHEMLEKQKQAFLAESMTTGGRQNLFYGIDAPWAAHSVYTTTEQGLTTVVSQKSTDNAHQWLYGGLRMGGKSYYGLDLSQMDKPTMLFHIDPENKKVHSKNTKTYEELSKMGQSWSKPALGYVNWPSGGKSERRLVMFVGGGYDVGYEVTNYNQTNKQGAGVYMFDAATGDLLWWASSEAVSDGNVPRLNVPDLKYSVVSRINTLDRDGDSLIDALYFGDLAGQGFRIDLNSAATTSDRFATRGTLLFNEHKEDGTSPRFYEMPDLSVYVQSVADKGDNKAFLAVSFGSGDRSSPLAGTSTNLAGQQEVRPTAKDGVFVVYDADVGRPDLHDVNFVSRHISRTLLDSNFTDGVPQMNGSNYNRGWKYIHDDVAGAKKFILEPFSFARVLFVNSYNKDGKGIDGQCGSGVAGNSSLLAFCMPTGKCSIDSHGFVTNPNTPTKPNESTLGVGLQGATAGGNSNKADNISVVGGPDRNGGCQPNDPRPICRESPLPPKINQLRWYESN